MSYSTELIKIYNWSVYNEPHISRFNFVISSVFSFDESFAAHAIVYRTLGFISMNTWMSINRLPIIEEMLVDR